MVFSGVPGAQELPGPVLPALDPRVMPRDELIRAQAACAVQQPVELDVLVAAHARVGRLAARVGADEVFDHLGAEALLRVVDVEPDAQRGGGAARVVQIVGRAAGSAGPHRMLVRRVQPQRYAEHGVVAPLFRHQRGGDGGVDSPGHGYDGRGHGRTSRRS